MSKVQIINFLDYADTKAKKKRAVAARDEVRQPIQESDLNKASSSVSTVMQMIKYGLLDTSGEKFAVKKVSLTNEGNFPQNVSQFGSYYVEIELEGSNKKIRLYIGEDNPDNLLEQVCKQSGIIFEHKRFNPASQNLQVFFGNLAVNLAPWGLGLAGALLAKNFKMKQIRSQINKSQNLDWGNSRTPIEKEPKITGDLVSQHLLGYNQSVYDSFHGMGTLLDEIANNPDVSRARDTRARVIFNGPPGTGKTEAAKEMMRLFLKRAEENNIGVYKVDISDIIRSMSSGQSRLLQTLQAEPNPKDIAKELMREAKKSGMKVLCLYAEDPWHEPEHANASEKIIQQVVKELADMLDKETDSTIKLVSVFGSNNAQLQKKSDAAKAGEARLPVIYVGTMEHDVRFKFVSNELKKLMGLTADQNIPEKFAKFLSVITATYMEEAHYSSFSDKPLFTTKAGGAVIRDYVDGGVLRIVKEILGTEGSLEKMQEIGNSFEMFLNETNSNYNPDQRMISIINKIGSLLNANPSNSKLPFSSYQELAGNKRQLQEAWDSIV